MKDLTTGNEARVLVSFAVPMLVGNVFQQLYNMVDTVVVGQWVGTSALAAVGASFPVVFLLLSLFLGLSMGANVLIARFFGAKDEHRVRATVETSYLVAFAGGIIFTVLGYFLADPVMTLLQAPAEIRPQAVLYLQITSLGMLPVFAFNTLSGILRGLGDSRTPLWMLIASTLSNIVLDLVFVIVFGWGVAGVAVATVISQGLAFAAAFWWINRRHEFLRIRFRELRFDRGIFYHSVRIGLPAGIQQALVALGLTAITGIVNTFGTAVIAGYAAATRIESLATLPALTISMAVSTFTGQNLGAGRTDRVWRGFWASMAISSGICVAVALALWFWGEPLVGLFNPDADVMAAGGLYLRTVGPFFILFTVMFMSNGVIRGAGVAMVPLVTTLMAMWVVRVPLAGLFAGWWGSAGVWIAMPTGWLIGMVVSVIYLATGRWADFDPGKGRTTGGSQAAPGHGGGVLAGGAGAGSSGGPGAGGVVHRGGAAAVALSRDGAAPGHSEGALAVTGTSAGGLDGSPARAAGVRAEEPRNHEGPLA